MNAVARRRDRSPPGLLAGKADAGVLSVRRGGRTRKAPPGERKDDVAGIHESFGQAEAMASVPERNERRE